MDSKVSVQSCDTHVTLEEAVEKTGFGKFNYALIILAGAILGCVFVETVGINFILPIAQCDLNMSTRDKGILSGIGFTGIIVSSHLWGLAISIDDRLQKDKLYITVSHSTGF